MLSKTLTAFALMSLTNSAFAFTVACEKEMASFEKTQLPKENYARYELDDSIQCRWTDPDGEQTPSVLFRSPSAKTTTEIEIATFLDAKGSTATHVALLNARFEPVQWIPFEAFKERKGSLVARFFINPDSNIRYILVGGAVSGKDKTLARTYSPLSSDLLNVAGLVTARERQTTFDFVTTGKIRVRIRKAKKAKVEIIS